MEVTALYVSLLGFLLIVLSARVIKARRKYKIGVGDAGNERLQCLIRAHANFIEYTPISLILLGSAEINGFVPVWCIHTLGLLLLIGRILHAHGMSHSVMPYRVRGMQLTFVVILLVSIANFMGVISRWVY